MRKFPIIAIALVVLFALAVDIVALPIIAVFLVSVGLIAAATMVSGLVAMASTAAWVVVRRQLDPGEAIWPLATLQKLRMAGAVVVSGTPFRSRASQLG
jgi:hypothetical protein